VHAHPGPVTMSGTAARLSRAVNATKKSWTYVLRMVSASARVRTGRGGGREATTRPHVWLPICQRHCSSTSATNQDFDPSTSHPDLKARSERKLQPLKDITDSTRTSKPATPGRPELVIKQTDYKATRLRC
jgi:hypothetical protein